MQAESNKLKILVLDPKDRVPSFGLVERGKQEAREVSRGHGGLGLFIDAGKREIRNGVVHVML